MLTYVILSVVFLLILVIAGLFFSWYLKRVITRDKGESLRSIMEENIRLAEQRSREIYREEVDRMNEILGHRLDTGERSLDHKKDAIKEMISQIKIELATNQAKLNEVEKDRIGEFNTLRAVIEEHKQITGGLKESADHLKNILSNNQLRGKYGEEVAENLLRSVGFVKGQHYTVNTGQETVSTRPDFTMLLPDKKKINIDAKFPLQALVKFQETEAKLEKERYWREFTTDVKQKIKQVTTRDYINPEENTVDFVILFVPNERIFSVIYDMLHEVWDDAMKKKVIMAGPFSFTAILRMIFQSYQSFAYQENLHSIIKLIHTFSKEYESFNSELEKLGSKIDAVETQYKAVSGVRTRKLSSVIEKIKHEDVLLESKAVDIID